MYRLLVKYGLAPSFADLCAVHIADEPESAAMVVVGFGPCGSLSPPIPRSHLPLRICEHSPTVL